MIFFLTFTFFFFFLITGNFWGTQSSRYGRTDCSELQKHITMEIGVQKVMWKLPWVYFCLNGIFNTKDSQWRQNQRIPHQHIYARFLVNISTPSLLFTWPYFHSTCVFLGSSIKYLLKKYSGHVKVRGAKSYKELDAREEQEVEWVKSGWAEKHKRDSKNAEWPLI